MISFPNAKINLGLNVVQKRTDGYHNIETVFYPIRWSDILEIIPGERKINRATEVQFKTTGLKIYGSKKKNLCIDAYRLLKAKYDLPPVQMHLHKIIPSGAGLGGGSSDAASTLILLNKTFNLNISQQEMHEIASSLGADCTFFIHNRPCFARDKGDILEEINIHLEDYFITVIKPDVHVSTKEAYKNITPKIPTLSIKEILKQPIAEWKNLLANDFEESVFKKHPIIGHLKEELYQSGAVYASMSGSGSAVYGIFREEMNLKNKFGEYLTWSGPLR